jgi:hypothetical protein
MIEHSRAKDDADGRAAGRLLEALSEAGARAAVSDIDERMIVVLAPRNGVTVVRANVPAGAAKRLIAEGLARWEGEGRSRSLRPTEAGLARLRRLAAPKTANPFLAQHAALSARPPEKGAAPVLCDEGESPLAWLARRKDRDGRPFLSPVQVEAGERFRRDVAQAQILQRVTANWEAAIASGRRSGQAGAHVTEAAIDARRRLSRAFEAVGPDLAGLLTDVCGYLKRLETVESERGWPQRSAKVVLKIALDRLAQHYGLASEARGRAASRGLLHWGTEDYRPQISADR